MIHRITSGFLLAVLALAGALPARVAQAVGEMPVPTLENVTVRATASYDSAALRYSYRYTVQNPAANSGEIWNLKLDIRTNPRYSGLPSFGLTIPLGTSLVPFDDALAAREPLDLEQGISVVPIGQQVPAGWHGGFGKDGYARFTAGNNGMTILPGASLSGFTLLSRGLPTIREAQAVPDWVLIVPDHDEVTDDLLDAAAAVERDLPSITYTLGPSSLNTFGSDDHWSQLAADIERAATLGWITDPALVQALRDQLAFARAALDQDDGTLAKTRLQTVLQTMLDSLPGQRNQEIFDLVVLNIRSLLESTPDTPIPFEPVYTLMPRSATLSIGTEHTVTAKVVNSADNDAPVEGYRVFVTIVQGPHESESWSGDTDANGEYTFSYTGTAVGTDHLVWIEEVGSLKPLMPAPIHLASLTNDLAALLVGYQPYPGALAEAEVTWTGGPDLVVPFFMPPEIQSQGGNPVYVTEVTQNIGILDAAESTTRYYLSASLPIDPYAARVIGERRVGPLTPDATSESGTVQFQLPADLPEGVYYLAACADADYELAELDEGNNCSFSELTTSKSTIVPTLEVDNAPPDCSAAAPSAGILWPPNHKLHDITLQGVMDPDGDPVTITVTGIRQDEPVNGLGDGDTSPDGFGVGTPTARVRAERSGLDNGRVYEIAFTADDGQGGTCEGTVAVGVPHDRGGQPVPFNDGANYDSTLP
ncbi:MAG TPA: CARDB domain-containing protein [Acidiferrobacterales bacterium]